MSCNCTPTKQIPYYPDSLVVGTIAADTDVWVYIFRDKRFQRYAVSSNEVGLLTVDLTTKEKDILSPYAALHLKVYDTDGNLLAVTLPDASTATELCLDVVRGYNEETLLDDLTATLEAI